MANTLTDLIPVIYAGKDIVSRELVGLCRACSLDSTSKMAAVNQTVRSPVAPSATTEDIVAGANPADSGDQAISYKDIVITKAKASPIRWTGEEQLSVKGELNTILTDQFAQALRALVNLVEIDLATTGYKGASRAFGTAATAPFGTAADFSDFAAVLKILEANGAPSSELKLALGGSALANLRGKQSGLFEVNRAGNDDLLRRGILGSIMDMAIHKTAQIQNPAVGGGTGYLVNNAGQYPVGTTTITLDTGSGTVLAGDIVTFAGDTNKYVVATGCTAAGDIVIAAPGLMETLVDNAAMTIVAQSERNLGFAKNALHLTTRHPAMPIGRNGKPGDKAVDVLSVTDDLSGLSFQVVMYKEYRRVKYEVCLAWGTAVIKPEHIMVLLG